MILRKRKGKKRKMIRKGKETYKKKDRKRRRK